MPTLAPSRPTHTPLKVRIPLADMANTPITRPRISAGAFSCTNDCAIELNPSSTNPAMNNKVSATT